MYWISSVLLFHSLSQNIYSQKHNDFWSRDEKYFLSIFYQLIVGALYWEFWAWGEGSAGKICDQLPVFEIKQECMVACMLSIYKSFNLSYSVKLSFFVCIHISHYIVHRWEDIGNQCYYFTSMFHLSPYPLAFSSTHQMVNFLLTSIYTLWNKLPSVYID